MGCKFVQNNPIDTQEEIIITKRNKSNQALTDIEKQLLSTSLLNEINFARTNPLQYSKKIDKYKLRVSYNASKKSYYFQANDNTEIAMNTGIDAIEKCIQFLSTQTRLNALKATDSLCLNKMTVAAEAEIFNAHTTSFSEIKKLLMTEMKDAKNQYNILSFHYDKTTPNGEIFAFCQIVDDTCSGLVRRRNIFNPKATHIGITCRNVSKGIVCFYIILGFLK